MAMRDAVHAPGLQVRAGLHTGECEIRGDDIGGIAVHIVGTGERTGRTERGTGLKHPARLGNRSGLEFDERGTHQFKGVPGEWHLFAVAL